jgi:hypothetical protein
MPNFNSAFYQPSKALSGKALYDAAKAQTETQYRGALNNILKDIGQNTANQAQANERLKGYMQVLAQTQADSGPSADSYSRVAAESQQAANSAPADLGADNRAYLQKKSQDFQQLMARRLADAQAAHGRMGEMIASRGQQWAEDQNRQFMSRDSAMHDQYSNLDQKRGADFTSTLSRMRESEAQKALARLQADYSYRAKVYEANKRAATEQAKLNQSNAVLNETSRHNSAMERLGALNARNSRKSNKPVFDSKESNQIEVLAQTVIPEMRRRRNPLKISQMRDQIARGFQLSPSDSHYDKDKGEFVPTYSKFSPRIFNEALSRYMARGKRKR